MTAATRRDPAIELVGRGAPALTYIIGTYPLLTTTFIDREIRVLRNWGAAVDVISLRRPTAVSGDQASLASTTIYVRPVKSAVLVRRHIRFLVSRPVRYLSTLFQLVTGRRQSVRQRLRTIGHFGLGVYVAGCIGDSGPTDRIHAHFIDRAATVSYVAARLLGVPYSVTAHANDIYVSPVLLDTKIRGADFVATCTGYNVSHLVQQVGGARDKVTRIYHGLELDRYQPSPLISDSEPTLVAVGQLKEKKGFLELLEACRGLLDRGIRFQCLIVGEGPQREELTSRIAELGLVDAVHLRGALPHDEVIDTYRRATAFVLPCVVAGDGDRDGIPNVILEAMAMQLPVISTSHSGIPEVVEDGVTGILVAPGDSSALTEALVRVLENPDEARRMGLRGRQVVAAHFDVESNVRELYDRFVSTRATR